MFEAEVGNAGQLGSACDRRQSDRFVLHCFVLTLLTNILAEFFTECRAVSIDFLFYLEILSHLQKA